MSKTIEIVVSSNGKLRIETKGFIGGECRQASLFVEEALGQRADEQLTLEFYSNSSEQQQLREPGWRFEDRCPGRPSFRPPGDS